MNAAEGSIDTEHVHLHNFSVILVKTFFASFGNFFI